MMLSDFTLPCHGKDSEYLIPCLSNEKTETKVLLTPHVLSLNNLDSLLEELLIEIIVRLPSKDAIRCKTVCKRWCSLISVNILNHHHLVLKLSYWSMNIEHCFPRQQSRGFIDLSFLPFPKEDMRLLATSADLMLCCQNNKGLSCSINFYVVNLLTKQWIALPPAPPGLLVDSAITGFICKPDYKSNLNTNFRFRIVRIPDGISKTPSFEVKIQVFLSEKCEWKWFNVSSPSLLKYCGFRQILVYKGLLHWLNGDVIFVYDPFCDPQRFSRVIDLPYKLSDKDCYGVSEGHLCVARLTGKPDRDLGISKKASISVWELENYNMGHWCLRHKIYLKQLSFIGTPLEIFHLQIRSLNCHIRILAFHPVDGNILYLDIGCYAVRCDMKKKVALDCIKEDPDILWAMSLLPSFELVITPSGPTPLPLLPHLSEPDMQEETEEEKKRITREN